MKRFLCIFLVSLVLLLNISVLAMASAEVEEICDTIQPPRIVGRMDWDPNCPPNP